MALKCGSFRVKNEFILVLTEAKDIKNKENIKIISFFFFLFLINLRNLNEIYEVTNAKLIGTFHVVENDKTIISDQSINKIKL